MPKENYPTDAMAQEAQRGLDWRQEYGRGGTSVGVARARDIVNKRNFSDRTIRRMVSYFARHEVDKQGEGFSPGEDGYPSAGRIAWALWGGDPGQSWANAWAKRKDRESNNLITMNAKLYGMETTDDEKAEIMLYDEIGSYGSRGIDIIRMSKQFAGQNMAVRINSPGGGVIEGIAIYNALERHKGGVTIHIDGLAASMASVIAMAGEKTYMAENAMMMIHNPWTMAAGDSEELRKNADLLDKMKNILVNSYAKKTGMDIADIEDLMDAETWMDAEEAYALGFVDEITKPMAAAASLTKNELVERYRAFSGGFDIRAQKDKTEPKMNLIERLTSPSNAEAQERIVALEGQISQHDTVVSEYVAKLGVAEAALQEATTEIVNLRASLDEAAEKLAEIESKCEEESEKSEGLEEKVEELTEKVEEITESVEAKAAEKAVALVAEAGISAPLAVEGQPEGPTDHIAIMAKMSPAERTKYFRENQKAIRAALK